MPKAKPIKIDHLSFRKQGDALEHFRKILHKYEDGQKIDDENDYKDLVALVERYDLILVGNGESPKGKGAISHFEKRLTDQGTSCFWIIRYDNTETDFSYPRAVKGKPKGDFDNFYAACSSAIAEYMQETKSRIFKEKSDANQKVECELTAKMIDIEEANIGHAQPFFIEIVKKFWQSKEWFNQIPDSIIVAPADSQTATVFAEESLAEEFCVFHNKYANLLIYSKSVRPIAHEPTEQHKISPLIPPAKE